MTKNNPIFTTLIISLLISTPSFGDNYEQQTINVTANRIETNNDRIASSVITINAEDLDGHDHRSIVRVIQDAAGIEIFNQGGVGKNSSLFIRGANSEHTLVLIDGIEINDPMSPTRAFDFARLNFDDIERIEIVKGPQGVLYGSDALGGVVHVITKKGSKGPLTPSLSIEGGSFAYQKLGLNLQAGTDKIQYSSSVSLLSTEGFSAANKTDGNSEEDGHHQADASFKVTSKIDKKSTVQFFIKYTDAKSELDNGGGSNKDDPNKFNETKHFFSKLQYKSFLFNENLESIFYVNYGSTKRTNRNEPDASSTTDSRETYEGQQTKIGLQNNYYLNSSNTLTLGFEFEEEAGKADSLTRSNANTKGVFVQSQNNWSNWFVTTGLRHDNHSKGKVDSTTFRLAPGYKIESTDTRLLASVGSGFKTPSLFQLFDFSYGNPDLKPESVQSFDIGIQQNFDDGHHNVGLTYFKNNFKNLFSYDPVTFKSINIAESETSGLELNFSSQISSRWSLSGHYTHLLTFKNKTIDENLIRRPMNSWNLRLKHNIFSDVSFALNYRHVGERDDFDAETFAKIIMPSHDIADLTINFSWAKNKDAFLRIENLLDKKYEEVDGYGTSPFAIYAGLKVSI